jgi:hypothetical protein
MVTAGSSYIYVEGLINNATFNSVSNKSLYEYSFVSEMNGDLEISKTSSYFCVGCYYIIAVQGYPNVAAELTINPSDKPILLK